MNCELSLIVDCPQLMINLLTQLLSSTVSILNSSTPFYSFLTSLTSLTVSLFGNLLFSFPLKATLNFSLYSLYSLSLFILTLLLLFLSSDFPFSQGVQGLVLVRHRLRHAPWHSDLPFPGAAGAVANPHGVHQAMRVVQRVGGTSTRWGLQGELPSWVFPGSPGTVGIVWS